MFQALYVSYSNGESLEIRLTDPYQHGIYVNNIEGLGYPQGNITSKKLSTYDVSLYDYTEIENRNIVLTLGLIGNPSAETSRHLIYEYLPQRTPIRLEFVTDERVGFIDGYVETIEPDIFNQQEVAQISVLCMDPYFYTGGSKKEFLSRISKPMFSISDWFTDGSKPVSELKQKLDVKFFSRIQNPKGFALKITGIDGGFDKAIIRYGENVMVVNDRELFPELVQDYSPPNYFNKGDSIIIKHDMNNYALYKLNEIGEITDLMFGAEQMIIEGLDDSEDTLFNKIEVNVPNELPQIVAGNNNFSIEIYGLKPVFTHELIRLYEKTATDQFTTTDVTSIRHYYDTQSQLYIVLPMIMFRDKKGYRAIFTFYKTKDPGRRSLIYDPLVEKIPIAKITLSPDINVVGTNIEEDEEGYKYWFGTRHSNQQYIYMINDLKTDNLSYNIFTLNRGPEKYWESDEFTEYETGKTYKYRIYTYINESFDKGKINIDFLGNNPQQVLKDLEHQLNDQYVPGGNIDVWGIKYFYTVTFQCVKPVVEGVETMIYENCNDKVEVTCEYDDFYEAM